MAKITAKEAILEILRKEGVEYVFGLPGATEVLFMAAMEAQSDIKYILGLNEIVVAGAAEGYARTSGKIGFLNLHTGPGLASALGMLYNAHRGGIPLIITAGQIDTRLLLSDPPLSGPMVQMAAPFTKWSAEVQHPEDIPLALQRAFKMALQPPTGPVFLSLPHDLMDKEIEFEYVPSTRLYLKMGPDRDALTKAAELLSSAKKPAIIVQEGVAKNNALSEVVKFAELIGAVVYQHWMSDVNFPVQHPLYAGDLRPSSDHARELLEPIDVLVAIGCPLFSNERVPSQPTLSRNTKVIQIDDDPWEIGKNLPVDVGIQANIKVAVAELVNTLEKTMKDEAKGAARTRANDIARSNNEVRAAWQKQAEAEKDNFPISISRLMQELRHALKPGTFIVDECWSSSAILRRTLNLEEPFALQRSRRGGSIGWGLPGALGVKLAAPDHPVVAVCGDGSAAWSMQSLWTVSHYNIPVTYIITVNASYRQCKYWWQDLLGGKLNDRHLGMELDEPAIDFCRLAESMGVHGERVKRPEALSKTLSSALSSDKPQLVEVLVENAP